MDKEIEAARTKNLKIKKTKYEGLYMNLSDLRFSTSDMVAEYRANRLKCNTIVDIGCGIGLQTIAFAKTCNKVYAIDIDERKVRFAKLNAKLLKLNNVKFFHGDALKLVSKFKDADMIFCETERAPSATERNLEQLKPNPYALLKTYKTVTENICIEVPAHIKTLRLNCEKEYLSINHQLNRLNLYFGNLKKCSVSVVALPSMKRLELSNKKALSSKKILKFLYEVDTAVTKAGLISELSNKNLYVYRKFLTSNFKIKNDFFKNRFKVLYSGKYSFKKIMNVLKTNNFGKVVLRQKVNPKEYWQLRNKYENKLNGKKTAHLFIDEHETILCEKL